MSHKSRVVTLMFLDNMYYNCRFEYVFVLRVIKLLLDYWNIVGYMFDEY